MNNIFFSIVIPTYNSEKTIESCLFSVLNQDFENYEIIIIDNNSSDRTIEIINKIKKNRKNLELYNISNRGIIAKSRNLGIKKANAEWICFLDSDDTWFKNKLSLIFDIISTNKYDLIYHDLLLTNNNTNNFFFKKKYLISKFPKKNITKQLLLNGNFIYNSSVIIKKKVLVKINLINENKDIIGSEDYNTWLKTSEITNKFLYIKKVLGTYNNNENYSNKNNLYFPAKQASKPFLKYLNAKELKQHKGYLMYINARFCHNSNIDVNDLHAKYMCVIKLGTFNYKIKSLILLFLNFFMIKI